MKTASRIILGICCLALAFQHAFAQPAFYPAAVDNAPLGNRIPLVLIHGIESDPSMWNNFLSYYAAHPSLANNFKPYLFGYQTDDGKMTSSDPNNIFNLSQILGKDLEQTFGTKSVAMLAHSMGGLVCRAEMEYYAYADKTQAGDRTLILITLATPHHGTPLANVFVDTYNTLIDSWLFDLDPGFAYNMEWDGYDGNSINGDRFVIPVSSSQDYSKIVAYGGQITSEQLVPSQDAALKATYEVINGYNYANDGAVPIGSALFAGANGVRTRQVDGSCDHWQIYSGQNTVNGGTPIFDSIATDLETVISIAAPTPVLSCLSPTSLAASSSPQKIEIIGSGFTSTSTLLLNGTAPTSGTVTFINQNEIDYVNTFTTAGTWSLQVVNGTQTSISKPFEVNAPSPTTGSLVVNLSPSGIGAQWEVDNTGYNDSGQVVGYITPGLHNVSFKPVSGYTTPTGFAVNIVAGQQTTTNATYTAVAPTTYTLTLNANSAQGSASASPTASGNVYNSGAAVQLTTYPNTGYHFTDWSGDLTGSVSPTNITMNGNKSITANFASGDPNLATLTVTIKPDPAANAGVTWSVTGDSQLRASGTSLTEAVGSGYTTYLPITLNLVAGWLGPNGNTSFLVPITAGIVTNVTLTCAANTTPGLLTVTLSPPDAVNAGAHWHVNGGAYGQSASVSLAPGTYTVTFDSVSGWTAPASQSVTIQPSGTAVISGTYTPPAGQPVIISISPPIAANTGGAVMTINGANLSTTTNVIIGGISASNIAVASATQITCLIPSSTTNGSVPVIVQTTGGSATNPNGFAYGVPLGTNMSLDSAIGGNCYGIYVQGNYAYVGEGKNLVILDVSAPSNPSRKGQVTLPGIVYDIQLLNQRAYIADGNGGLQVVDVSDPTAPKIAGFYSSTNITWTMGISILGGRAYVANEDAGLEIFSLANPTTPTLLSSTNIGRAVALIVKASSNGAFAYVSDGNNLHVVDVSNPNAPVARGQTSTGDWGGSYALSSSGNYVFQADPSSGIHMIDVSNPDAPTNNTIQITGDNGTGGYVALAAANNYLYVESVAQGVGFRALNINGSSLSPVGQNINLYAGNSYAERMFISGGQAYVASGALGLQIVNISNPANPSLTSSFTDSGLYGDYGSVGVTGNILCASDGNNLKCFDVSQTGQPPTFVGQVSGIGAYKIAAANGIAYITASDGIRLYSLATPSNPQLESSVASSVVTSEDSQIVGTRLYVAGYFISGSFKARFKALDVSNPSAPVVLGGVDFLDSSIAESVAVNGNKALVGINTGRISLLDISNVSSPVERGSIATTGNPGAIQPAVQISPNGNYAYYILYGESPSLLHVVDISNLSNPLTVTNVPVDTAGAVNISLRGSELYAGTYNGLYVFDISNPASPTLTRSYQMAGISSYVGGICAPTESANQSSSIYIADEDGGIVSLQEQDIQAPDVYITDPIFGNFTTTTTSSTELGGGSDDNVGVTAIAWSNNRGGSGQVSPPLDNWYVPSIALYPGTNILTVTAYDAAGNSGTDALTVVYQTTNQNQSITFPAVADHTFGDPPIQLTAAASSGLPVTFSVVSGPAALSSSNTLTLTGAGAVTIEADQPGNSLFNPAAPVDVSFNVARANQAIAFAPLPDKSAGDAPFALTATASSGLPVSFNIISGPAVSSSNVVTLLGGGRVTVVAWQPGNANYNAALTVQQSFNVSKIPQTITFGALSAQKVGDAPFPVNATASSGLPVSYSVSGPATLSGNIVTLTGYGTVTVTASQAGNNIYAASANVTQSFTVAPPDNTLVGLGFQNGSFQMAFYGITGSNYTFKASSNLLDWQPFTNFILTGSPQYFSDAGATNFSRRFYRAVIP